MKIENRTRTLWGRKTKLTIYYNHPNHIYRLEFSSTVARWIKFLLEASGMDASIFNAHSVKGVSSSAAVSAGILASAIFKAGSQSFKSAFQKFYCRSTSYPSFDRVALNQH